MTSLNDILRAIRRNNDFGFVRDVKTRGCGHLSRSRGSEKFVYKTAIRSRLGTTQALRELQRTIGNADKVTRIGAKHSLTYEHIKHKPPYEDIRLYVYLEGSKDRGKDGTE